MRIRLTNLNFIDFNFIEYHVFNDDDDDDCDKIEISGVINRRFIFKSIYFTNS